MATTFTPSTENLTFANNTVQQLDGLRTRRMTWEATDYKKSNEGLYALLADTLDVFNGKFIIASEDNRKTLRKELEGKLKTDGIKVQRNTTTLTMLIRYVFGSDRKRAHGYAYVLKAAISHDVQAKDLSGYIAEQGGIEEIKRKMVVSEAALARKAEIAKAKSEVEASIEVASINPLAKISLDGLFGKHAILLAKPGVDGEVSIVGVLPDVNESLYNALLVKMAKHKAANNAEAEAMATEVQDLLSLPSNDDTAVEQLAA